MSNSDFKSKLLQLRPDVAIELERNRQKRKLALALRALRKEKGLTQKDIAKNSTLSQPLISRLETPTGSLPNWDTIMRYVEACGGHMLLSFSPHEFDESAFVDSQANESEPLVAMAV